MRVLLQVLAADARCRSARRRWRPGGRRSRRRAIAAAQRRAGRACRPRRAGSAGCRRRVVEELLLAGREVVVARRRRGPSASRRSTRLLPMNPAAAGDEHAHAHDPVPAPTAQAVRTRILQVEPQRPVVDVLEIHPHPVVEVADPVAAAHLPQARDARPHAQLPLVPQLVALELVRERRARADQAHVSLEHAPQLRQLVQAVLAQEAPERRHARIVPDLEDRALSSRCGRAAPPAASSASGTIVVNL